jgi:serine phosphatase RsbU (regulator of sigma subunit)
MQLLKKILLSVAFVLTPILCQSQSLNKLDSLKIKLSEEKSDTGKAVLLYRISYELQFSDPEEAQKYAQMALDESEKARFRKGTGNSLIQFGNIQQMKGDSKKAEEYYLQALDILEEVKDMKGVAICYNNLGILAHNANDFSKALDYYGKSVIINRNTGRRNGEASSLFGIGTLYENQEKYDSALKYFFRAIEISESIGDNRLMSYGKMSLANLYFEMENYALSLKYNEEAIALLEKTENYFGLLKVYSTLGQTSELLDKDSLAIWFYNQAIKICEIIQSPADEAGIHFSVARLMENSGKTDSAEINYEKSYILFKNSGNRENEALSLIAMARLKNYRYDFSGAKEFLNEALIIAKETNSPSALTEGYREIAMSYSGLKQFNRAFLYLNKYSQMKDSLLTVEKQKQILELQTRYETDKKDKENLLLRKDSQILKSTRNSLIIGALLLITLALVIFRSLTIKKRDNRLLQQQKEETERQKEIVEQQKTSITDSIRYAKRIQSAMLPPQELVDDTLPDSFILYLPRDIVSGDFYWLRRLSENRIILSVADCTGHGVPGAFMSMLGMSMLNDIASVNLEKIIKNKFTPADILNEMRERIKGSLRQTGREGEARDGMDMSLCLIETDTGKLTYAGANNSIYIVNNETLTELKATRNPIGIYLNELGFANNTVTLEPGSVVYMFSDGFSDQIGSSGGKFLSKNFKGLLSRISHLPLEEIRNTIYEAHLEWRGEEEQVDDILVAGFRFSGKNI